MSVLLLFRRVRTAGQQTSDTAKTACCPHFPRGQSTPPYAGPREALESVRTRGEGEREPEPALVSAGKARRGSISGFSVGYLE